MSDSNNCSIVAMPRWPGIATLCLCSIDGRQFFAGTYQGLSKNFVIKEACDESPAQSV
jgi:hypothetical protein